MAAPSNSALPFWSSIRKHGGADTILNVKSLKMLGKQLPLVLCIRHLFQYLLLASLLCPIRSKPRTRDFKMLCLHYSVIAGDTEGYNHDLYFKTSQDCLEKKKKKTKCVSLSKVSQTGKTNLKCRVYFVLSPFLKKQSYRGSALCSMVIEIIFPNLGSLRRSIM